MAPDGATSGRIEALRLQGSTLYAVGSATTTTDPDALYATIDAGDLEVQSIELIHGSDGNDLFTGVVAPASGELWMTGTTNAFSDSRVFGVKATPEGTCTLVGPDGRGSGQAVVEVGGDIYVGSTYQDSVLIQRYDPSACVPAPMCACDPDLTMPLIQIGDATTLLVDLIHTGSDSYIVGRATDADGDVYGYISHIEITTGAVRATFRWNPTTEIDGFTASAVDGTTLYAVGGFGWDGQAGFGSTQAIVMALALPIANNSEPEWIASPADSLVFWGIAVESLPAGGIYVDGVSGDGGVVIRCPKSGDCPDS